MASSAPLRVLSLGKAALSQGVRRADRAQMGAASAAYQAFSSWRMSWRSSATP